MRGDSGLKDDEQSWTMHKHASTAAPNEARASIRIIMARVIGKPSFRARVRTNRVEELDLLGDKLIARSRMLLLDDRTRAVDPGSAVRAIREAHRDLRDELEMAAALSA